MAKKRKSDSAVAMLEMWRAPAGAGEPIGCLATTFTFQPGLFEEQCLARFLQVDSDPQREELAYLLEREANLGKAYAGVLVDRSQAGVEHSLRWDVLSVHIPRGKQHAKISLLAWENCVRVIVSSANLTEQGYRSNQEVTIAIDSNLDGTDQRIVAEAVHFLESLIDFVPSGDGESPQKKRATAFLEQVKLLIQDWPKATSDPSVRQLLVATLPRNTFRSEEARSALSETVKACLKNGGPEEIWVASPFFDVGDGEDVTTAALCKAFARGRTRSIYFAVPSLDRLGTEAPRLAAPKSLLVTSKKHVDDVEFEILPYTDAGGNERPWHAKMLALRRYDDEGGYAALMIGSSNFTKAGMGIGGVANAELNLLTIAKLGGQSKVSKQLDQVWPEMETVENLSEDLLLGPAQELEEEERTGVACVPLSFVSATFRAGSNPMLTIDLDSTILPTDWLCQSLPQTNWFTLNAGEWIASGSKAKVEVEWQHATPPSRLLVRWLSNDGTWSEGFLPINVDCPDDLPAPTEIQSMSADDLLMILAASDPGAALRVWTKALHRSEDGFDEDLDSAEPADLDPLRAYSLANTFLHRIRNRARIFARLRQNLERPARTKQTLLWRLEGFIGVKALAERLCAEAMTSSANAEEALLSLIDFIILLREVNYSDEVGAVTREQFDAIYLPFLSNLVRFLDQRVRSDGASFGKDLLAFWGRTIKQCQQ
jgi:hypothetical protein